MLAYKKVDQTPKNYKEVLVMKKKLLSKSLVSALVIVLLTITSSSVFGEELIARVDEVALYLSGSRVAFVSGEVIETPIFSIRIGDTLMAEAGEKYFAKYFYGFARNGTFYQPIAENQPKNWLAETFRRPATKVGRDAYLAVPLGSSKETYSSFYNKQSLNSDALPLPLRLLSNDELSHIEFFVQYLDRNGIRIQLRGTSRKKAKAITAKIVKLLSLPKV